jgi:7-cyano-7-deazaguanine synthase
MVSPTQKPAVVLLSGGLDSATALALANQSYQCYSLSFDYAQRSQSELNAAARLAKLYSHRHQVIHIDSGVLSSSALTDEAIKVPVGDEIRQQAGSIPSTYVPARNTLFLAHALAIAEVIAATDIFIGVNAVDYSGYPDCRPEYIAAFENMANLATRMAVEGAKMTIHTPLIDMSKAEIIRLGHELGVDYTETVSCYQADAQGLACGVCDSCLLRKKGFEEAGLADATRYRQ